MRLSHYRLSSMRAATFMLLAWCLCMSQAQAQTVVSGTLANSTTWRAASGPYVVTADVTLANGVTLTIEAGTQIYMGAGTSLISNGGAIHANGTALAPIKVQSDKLRINQSPAAGDWKRWQLGATSIVSNFNYVLFEHGQTLEFNSNRANLNHCTIRTFLGAAITQNLAASLSGRDNSASGNGYNAVLLPPGDITGSANWALQGIPYLLAAGQISVGASPQITIMTPGSMQSGDTLTATVSGTRLSGASNARLSGSGVTAQILPGGSATQLSLQLAATSAAAGDYTLFLETDAGPVSKSGALSVLRQQPRIATLDPASIYLNRGNSTINISGSHLANNSVAQLDDAPLVTSWQSASQIQALVPNQTSPGNRTLTLRTPDAANPGQFLTSNPAQLAVLTPVATLTPLTLSMIVGNNKPAQIGLPFVAPAGGITFSLASSNSLVAAVPGTVTVAEGQQTVSFEVQGSTVGSASIGISASGWQNATLPVTVIEPPRALNLSPINAPAVGVLIGNAAPVPPALAVTPVGAARVGVLLGSAIRAVQPKAGVVGSELSVTVQGVGLGTVSRVELVPDSGLLLGAPTINGDGTQLEFGLRIAFDAALGGRQLRLFAGASQLTFANPDDAMLLISPPVPEFDSVSPQVLPTGQTTFITVRGRNLRNISGVRLVPADGVIISNVATNADASVLTAQMQVDASASVGQRVLLVQSAAGESRADATPGNTLQVVRQPGAMLGPVNAALVGVQVGSSSNPGNLQLGPVQAAAVGVLLGQAELPPAPRVATPLSAARVGALVGALARHLTPKAAVVGTQIQLTVQGIGLNSVVAADFVPNAGLTLGNLQINPDGTRLSLSLSVAADAAKTTRQLVLRSASGPVLFADPEQALLLVAAPAPTLSSITPQVLLAGQSALSMTLSGINLRDVLGVRAVPPDGIGPISVQAVAPDGSSMRIGISADATASSGPRTLVVMTAGGDSSAEPVAGNTFYVARQTGARVDPIHSPLVGVQVGSPPAPAGQPRNAFASAGVVVGALARQLTPAGALKGSSGQWQIDGTGLAALVDQPVRLLGNTGPAVGVQIGSAQANAEGTRLIIPFTVAADAPNGQYQLQIGGSGNAGLWFVPPSGNQFQVLDEPQIDSVAPTILQTGRAYTLTVRGRKLQSVHGITLEGSNGPLAGVRFESGIVWGSDASGESLTVRLLLDPATEIGPVRVRLYYPAGSSSDQASSANTINIVNP